MGALPVAALVLMTACGSEEEPEAQAPSTSSQESTTEPTDGEPSTASAEETDEDTAEAPTVEEPPQSEPPRSDGQTPTPLAAGVQAVLPEGWVVEPRAVAGNSEVPTSACLRDPADAEQLVCNVSMSVGHPEPPEESGSGQECTTEDVQVGDHNATRTRYAQGDCAAEDPGTTDVWWVPDLSLSIRATADQDVTSLLSSVEGDADTGEISGHVARLVETDGATLQVELLEHYDEADPDNADVVTGEAEFTLTEETRCFTPRPSDPMINDPVPCLEAAPWSDGYRGVVTVLVNDADEVIALSQPFE